MNLTQAQQIADHTLADLSPHCERIQIAGSVSRRVPEPNDIEIVCIPKTTETGLFLGGSPIVDPEFCSVVNRWIKVKGEPTGKYTQRILPEGIALDIFIARPENWGLILAIRTGSADFSHKVLASAWCRKGYHSVDGMLLKDGRPVPIREESELFCLLGLQWIPPWERNL